MVATRWWRAARHWNGLELAYLVTTVPFSLVTLVVMVREDGIGMGSLISLPVWLTLLAASVVLAAMLLSRGRREPVLASFRREGRADAGLAQERIAWLDPARAGHLREQRAEAIATLQRRGLIDDAEATDLSSRPLDRFHDDVYR